MSTHPIPPPLEVLSPDSLLERGLYMLAQIQAFHDDLVVALCGAQDWPEFEVIGALHGHVTGIYETATAAVDVFKDRLKRADA